MLPMFFFDTRRSFFAAVLATVFAFSGGVGCSDEERDVPRSAAAEKAVAITGRLELKVLTGRELVLCGDYSEFLSGRFRIESKTRILGAEKNPHLQAWSRKFHYDYAGTELIARYRPEIAAAWQRREEYHLRNEAGLEIAIPRLGYWLNSTGQARFPGLDGKGEWITRNADVVHFAFLSLAEPLPAGKYTLTTPLGEALVFDYNPETAVSELFKFNQLGFSPSAGRKYAYIGAWRGDLGALPLGELDGAEFFLVDGKSGERVWSGRVGRRGGESFSPRGIPFTGEEVGELDFSAFNRPGVYRLMIPGVGRSFPFRIGNDSVGEAFYIHARGLYHQRCGIARTRPFTAWTSGACHTETRQGNFPPDDSDYNQRKGDPEKIGGFFDSAGKNFRKLRHFEVISLNTPANAPLLPGVSGGWHDAADYDRRPYHFSVVNDLLAAWLFFPENFSDGQLNIPESGNGLPDIVDEALYGLEVWRKAQHPDGGVGTWIEANSHPAEYNPALDRQRYYLSAISRRGTLQYAAHASMAALVLGKLGDGERSGLYLDSARRAFDYALDPTRRLRGRYRVRAGKGSEFVRYQEAAELPDEVLFKAAFNLLLLDGDERYRRIILDKTKEISRAMGDYSWRLSPFFFAEFHTEGGRYPEFAALRKRYEGLVNRFGDETLAALDSNYPYRTPWHSPEHAFVSHMNWGNCHPLRRARYLVTAWRLTGDRKYRDGAFIANDFHNGANPLGLTMTSGLGRVYPVRFLDLPAYADGIAEFPPGITPYRHSYFVPRGDAQLVHGLYIDPRPDHQFVGQARSLLPLSLTGGNELSFDEHLKLLESKWPVWRRFGNVESYSVAASEFTINETIAPAAAVTGCLLEPGFMPGDELKNRRPAADIRDLPGYTTLP